MIHPRVLVQTTFPGAPERGVLFGEMTDGTLAVQLDDGSCVRAFHPSKVERIKPPARHAVQRCPDCGGRGQIMGHQDCPYPGVSGGM